MAPYRPLRAALLAGLFAVALGLPAPSAAEDAADDSVTLFPTSGAMVRVGKDDQKAVGSFVYRAGAVRLSLQASAPLSEESREAAFLATDGGPGSFQGQLVIGYDTYAGALDGPLRMTPEEASAEATVLVALAKTYGAPGSEGEIAGKIGAARECGTLQLVEIDVLRAWKGLATDKKDDPFTCGKLMEKLGEPAAACDSPEAIDAVWHRHEAAVRDAEFQAPAWHEARARAWQQQLRRFGLAADTGRWEPPTFWFVGAEIGGAFDRVKAAPVGDPAGAVDWRSDYQFSAGLHVQLQAQRRFLFTGRAGFEVVQDVATETVEQCTETPGAAGKTDRTCRDVRVLTANPELRGQGYARLGFDWFLGDPADPADTAGGLADRTVPGLELRASFEELGGDGAAQARFRVAGFIVSAADFAGVKSGLAVDLTLAIENDDALGRKAGELVGVTPLFFVGGVF